LGKCSWHQQNHVSSCSSSNKANEERLSVRSSLFRRSDNRTALRLPICAISAWRCCAIGKDFRYPNRSHRPQSSCPATVRRTPGAFGFGANRIERLYRERIIRHALSSNSNATRIKRQPHPQHEACMFYSTPNPRRLAEAGPQKVGLIASVNVPSLCVIR